MFNISRSDHETHLKEVNKIIYATGFRLNHEKCKYYLEEIKFLGRIINKDGIKIDRESLNNSLLNRIPRKKKQIQRLIGIQSIFFKEIKFKKNIIFKEKKS